MNTSALPIDADAKVFQIASVALLSDDVRRALYTFVSTRPDAVGRDQAASALGISRPAATFHLERLLTGGLLEATFRRLSGKTGPGAGRPAKLYRRSARTVSVSLPPRNYELMANLQASALDASGSRKRIERAARKFGAGLAGAAVGRVRERPGRRRRIDVLTRLLAELGFEPNIEPDGTLRLRNCPFPGLGEAGSTIACDLNLALMQGIADGVGMPPTRVRQETRADSCCVAFDVAPGHG